MGTNLVAKRCYDYSEILPIINHDAIWDCICEDGINSYIPDLINEFWVCIYSGPTNIGCYRIHATGAICYEIHAFIIPEHRKKHSMDASRLILEWAVKNVHGLEKIFCKIPSLYKNVVAHTVNMGFSREGSRTECFLKNGKIYDLEFFGITKSHIEEILRKE